MRLKPLFALLAAWSLLQPAAQAYPGKNVAETRTWLLGHKTFSPANYFVQPGPGLTFGSYKVLAKNRELVLTVHYDPNLAVQSQPVLYERLSVFHQRLQNETPCHEALAQGAAESIFFRVTNDEPFNRVWSACQLNTLVDFRQRDSGAAALASAYGPKDPMIADFLAATPAVSVTQSEATVWDDKLAATVVRPIQPGPIDTTVLRGQSFDYIVTANTITVVYKAQLGFWNDWRTMVAALNAP